MDLAAWPARWFARGVAKALDVEGRTPEERRDKILRDISMPVEDSYDLAIRHGTRLVIWLITTLAIFPGWIAVIALMRLILGGHDKASYQVVAMIAFIIVFFVCAMMCIHGVKLIVAAYLLEGRWNPDSRLWWAVMLAQTPDIVVAVILAVSLALSY